MANKVLFGLKTLAYAIKGDSGWGTPVNVPGPIKMALTKTGTPTTHYAGDAAYVTFEVGGGYEGDLELSLIPDTMLKAVLGYGEDSVGAIYEESKVTPVEFALLYEVEGDEKNRRGIFYNVTASRPAKNANTSTDSTTVDTQTLPLTIGSMSITSGSGSSAITKDIVQAWLERSTTSATAYDAWWTTVFEPTFSAA